MEKNQQNQEVDPDHPVGHVVDHLADHVVDQKVAVQTTIYCGTINSKSHRT